MLLYSGFNNKDWEEDHLWEALRNGSREALDQLFRRFYSPLFDYGVKIISEEEIVKDCIQELFLKLWKRRAALSQAQSVQAYLLFSLRRILMRQISRRTKRYQRNKEYLDEVFSASFSMEDIMISAEVEEGQKQALIKAINHLNSRQKETLFLRYYHGLTNAEIADIININRQSVKNNLSRAIKSLRSIIPSVPSVAE